MRFAELVYDIVEPFGVGRVAPISSPEALDVFPLDAGEVFVQSAEEVITLPVTVNPISYWFTSMRRHPGKNVGCTGFGNFFHDGDDIIADLDQAKR